MQKNSPYNRSMVLSRRRLLAALPLAAAGCAPQRSARTLAPAPPRLARVHVSPDRVIRTTVGLRPFRPSGFVVRAEKLGEKTVIHNYGHGGSGITLSWGSAALAADLALPLETRQCVVIGCGVIGLSTARLLQLRGYAVTIYTQAMPPLTTTNVAGGLWEPVSLYDEPRVTPQFRTQFASAARFAFRYFQSLAGADYAVSWLPLYSLSTHAAHQAPSSDNPASDVESLYPEPRQLTAAENPFSVAFAFRRYSMLIEPAPYLTALLRDFHLAGGRVVLRSFQNPRDLAALPEPLLFNCTGLGAKALFNDEELTPIRGQIVDLLPQPEVAYMTLGPGNTYMFPRRDGIVLGGTFDRGVSNLDPDPATSERILRENKAIFDGMKA
jgi:glycine/D-amino acid oxidase-like deaminating enzyme